MDVVAWGGRHQRGEPTSAPMPDKPKLILMRVPTLLRPEESTTMVGARRTNPRRIRRMVKARSAPVLCTVIHARMSTPHIWLHGMIVLSVPMRSARAADVNKEAELMIDTK